MEKALLSFINRFVEVSEIETKALSCIFHKRKLKRKEHFVIANHICRKALFFEKGYFRFYHYDSTGNEITSDFYFAPGFITSYTSFINEKPSMVNVQAMVDMDILEFSKQNLYELYNQYPNIERLGRLIAESVAIKSEEHLFMLLNQTAEVRYKTLLDKNPWYVNTIPLQYIASYLGITKETLSRMRKSLQ